MGHAACADDIMSFRHRPSPIGKSAEALIPHMAVGPVDASEPEPPGLSYVGLPMGALTCFNPAAVVSANDVVGTVTSNRSPGHVIYPPALRSRARRANSYGRMENDGTRAKQSAAAAGGATQTVKRAIDILVAVADGPILLVDLAERLGLSTTTCYRLAKTLVDQGMLTTSGRSGYRLGYRISELGAAYERQRRGK